MLIGPDQIAMVRENLPGGATRRAAPQSGNREGLAAFAEHQVGSRQARESKRVLTNMALPLTTDH